MSEKVGESLRAMPLHAVTQMYGFEGLKERFDLEIADFSESSTQQLLEAYTLAERLHASDSRQSEPYINHLLRVTMRMHTHYELDDVDVLTAGLLHDTVEDHPIELSGDGSGDRDKAVKSLRNQFNERVAGLVLSVSNPEEMAESNGYGSHVTELLEDPWARVIKTSDFTDNAVGIFWTAGEKRTKLANKYLPLFSVFYAAIERGDTPLSQEVKERILGQLATGQDRVAQILG